MRPGEDRQPPHRHAGGAHADHRGDHVDAAEDGAEAGDRQTHDPQVTADSGRMLDAGQRRVGGPAEGGRTVRGEEPGGGDDRAEEVQPVGEGVQPRERDVRRADLQRQHEVGETEHHGGRIEQQHDRAVHGEQLVVLLGGEELHTRLRQFGPHEQRHQAADHEPGERGGDVHDAKDLGVRGVQILQEFRPARRALDRVRPSHHRTGSDGGQSWPPAGRRTQVSRPDRDGVELSPTLRRTPCQGVTTSDTSARKPPRDGPKPPEHPISPQPSDHRGFSRPTRAASETELTVSRRGSRRWSPAARHPGSARRGAASAW